MAKAYFMVRAVVEEPLRQKFDHWYSTHHLPMALEVFKAEKCGSGVPRMRPCITPCTDFPTWRGSMQR